MPIKRDQAEKLCTATEFQLFRASQRDQVRRWTVSQLEKKVERARALRDKQQDLFRRQRLADRARTGTKGGQVKDTNLRTEQKAQAFAETLARFEARLAQLTAPKKNEAATSAKPTAKPKPRKAAKATAAVVAKPARPAKAGEVPKAATPATPKPGAKAKKAAKKAGKGGFTSESALVASRTRKPVNVRGKSLHGHVGSAGKRNQAKRDKRG